MISKRRRGQIFLILTILVISFIITISSVLLEIKQSDFIDPAPDENVSLRAWEITVDNLHQIMDVYLAKGSQNFAVAAPSIDPALTGLRNYLTNRGITNSISYSALVSPFSTNSTNIETISTSATFNVYLATASTSITQTVSISISYTIDASVGGNTIVVNKIVDGRTDYLSGCAFSITVTDIGSGAYTYITGGITIAALTPSNVLFQVAIP